MGTKKLWKALGVVFILSFAVLLWIGREIYLTAPPVANVIQGGQTLYSAEEVMKGQQTWQTTGGQQLGSLWGHGSYVAPDWSADWLHREAVALQNILAQKIYHRDFSALSPAEQAAVNVDLKKEMRTNTYDAATNTLTVSPERAQAMAEVAQHYTALFGDDPGMNKLREQYAMGNNLLPNAADKKALNAFFFWSSWASVTDRPGEQHLSYTSNWPHDPLVGNTLTTNAAIWSIVSIVLLLAGIAAMVWYHSAHEDKDELAIPTSDPFINASPTPSMRATAKYFFVVTALFMVQIAMGVITAHYSVEGEAFFGVPLAQVLPYVVSRTIHTQFAVFWIATAWLATGLYIAPLLAGKEPKFQRAGVNVLFCALLIVVAGSMVTGWLGTLQKLGFNYSFWLGNQGLEYTSMGRIWQIMLFIGLLFWFVLLVRALWPALKTPSDARGIIAMVVLSGGCIGLFYASSLVWGKSTHYSIIEYWRWWLVHLWVEGFFEVFAAAVIALIFAKLGLVRVSSANRAIVMETVVFLTGGILGTLHHLYFTGTPTSAIAIGAVFSALEVVPLAILGFEGWSTYKRLHAAPWVKTYRWPIMCFVAVGFWNTVGAGLLGFAINPPISLYYVQGINSTPAHGHAALFGVYGMLGIGLMLFCLRGLFERNRHADKLLAYAFWCMNIGLAMMVFMSLVPAGIYQASASVSKGLWYARSAEVVHSSFMETMVWLRVPGDILFGIGGLFLCVYIVRLLQRKPAELAENVAVATAK